MGSPRDGRASPLPDAGRSDPDPDPGRAGHALAEVVGRALKHGNPVEVAPGRVELARPPEPSHSWSARTSGSRWSPSTPATTSSCTWTSCSPLGRRTRFVVFYEGDLARSTRANLPPVRGQARLAAWPSTGRRTRARRTDGPRTPRRTRQVVEPRGLEPLTPCLQSRCATDCAKAPVIPRTYPGTAARRGKSHPPPRIGHLIPEHLFGLTLVQLSRRTSAGGAGGRGERASSSWSPGSRGG